MEWLSASYVNAPEPCAHRHSARRSAVLPTGELASDRPAHRQEPGHPSDYSREDRHAFMKPRVHWLPVACSNGSRVPCIPRVCNLVDMGGGLIRVPATMHAIRGLRQDRVRFNVACDMADQVDAHGNQTGKAARSEPSNPGVLKSRGRLRIATTARDTLRAVDSTTREHRGDAVSGFVRNRGQSESRGMMP